jgi:hypothetical protein
VPAGETALIVVLLCGVKDWAGTEPKVTDVAPENPFPVMSTVVPPPAGPWSGLRRVTDVAIAGGVADGGYTTKVVESLAPLDEVTVAESCCGAGWLDEQPLGGAEIPVIVTVGKAVVSAFVAIWL